MSKRNSEYHDLSDLDKPTDEILQRVEALCAEMADLSHSCLEIAGLPRDKEPTDAISLTWTQGMDPHLLAEALVDQARACASDFSVFKQGHVFCYRCNVSTCEHASQPEPGMVFMGYENNGQPIWQEFFNALHALGDDRVDQIFATRPKTLARLVGRKKLITDQFVGGGRNSMTYRIIGEVVAGYFEVSGDRCAITIQVVENVKRNLHLQFIAPESALEALAESDSRRHQSFFRLYDAIQELRHKLKELDPQWRTCKGTDKRRKIQDKIIASLRHMVNIIERKGRQSDRRTKHAHARSHDNRPVHTAIDDLKAAGRDAFYLDRARQSVIVMARRGRAHVFSKEGKHVTTLSLSQERLERRVNRKRYAPMMPEEVDSFRAAVDALSADS